MAKHHSYSESAGRCCDCGDDITPFEVEGKRQEMMERCLTSIQDLLDEEARSAGTVLSIQQLGEMEEIIKDARVQGLMS